MIVIGERTVVRSTDGGEFACPVCGRLRAARRVVETRWFTVFFLRFLPLDKRADFVECSGCDMAFVPGEYAEPSVRIGIRYVLAYFLLGYGMQQHEATAVDIYRKVSGVECPLADFRHQLDIVSQGACDVPAFLTRLSRWLNMSGKAQIIEAAYLLTRALCEVGHEERVRINLVGSAMGVSLEFVAAAIGRLREQDGADGRQ